MKGKERKLQTRRRGVVVAGGGDKEWAIGRGLSPENSDLKDSERNSGPSQIGGNGSVAKWICAEKVLGMNTTQIHSDL